MYVKTFTDEKEVNKFMDSLAPSDQNNIHYAEDRFIVFYESTNKDYQKHFLNQMLTGLNNNLFHERVRKASADAEVEKMKELGTNLEGFDEAKNRQKEADRNIQLFEAKIAALQVWDLENTYKK